MTHKISVVETLCGIKNEVMEDEDKFIERVRSVVNKVRNNRKDLKRYELSDMGFYHDEGNNIKVKLYFVYKPGLEA